ncbi:hypothetical protein OAG24_00440 [bacterium]|nr:hypothetical protein [bacterium]
MSKSGNLYVTYDDNLEVDQLDRNTFNPGRTVIFPKGLYAGDVIPDPHYLCNRPRDTDFNYIIGVERERHPDHYSRFGYARNFYGYASGHWPGRYQEDRECACEDYNPPDTAPARFYGSSEGPISRISEGNSKYESNSRYYSPEGGARGGALSQGWLDYLNTKDGKP